MDAFMGAIRTANANVRDNIATRVVLLKTSTFNGLCATQADYTAAVDEDEAVRKNDHQRLSFAKDTHFHDGMKSAAHW